MEMFQLIEKDGNPAGSAERALSKDTHPGAWDTSVGGHALAGEHELPMLKAHREPRP